MNGLTVLAIVISGLATWLLARYAHRHLPLTRDSGGGPQKFHRHDVARVGGVAIVLAVAASLAIAALLDLGPHAEFARQGTLLLVCALPAFAGGLAEDLTKRVRVGLRLAATMLAAAVAFFLLDGVLDRVDVAGLDHVLQFGLVSLLFTMIAVGGIANAINIIDGYNGLAGMVSLFILAAMAVIAHRVGDPLLAGLALLVLGATAGFLVLNFPRGRIFLGDGGAYFIGFMIGELAVLLVRRHPEVSPWFPLMLVAYPVWETLFSIYRKKLVRGHSPGRADALHFHQLIYRRVMLWKVGSRDPAHRMERNSLTSPYLWAFSLTTIVPALLFWDDTLVLGFSAFAFAFVYVRLYRRIVTFRVPAWMIIRKRAVVALPDFADEWEPTESRERS